MRGGAGSRTPQAPRSGARGCRFCRVRIKTGANSGLCGAPHNPDYAKLSVMRSGTA